ncbi:hypothetical protein [Enterococcus raffinosus]|uniref:Uncharacterized protein n=1 Tax=Enterococcus raffinosus TaxID=71452 RepID=A0AAW8T9S2_9ENTE|nr:hypothetical protein [Enterococcus raffinosus]MDT2522087.1 hypothetical protein [Enterococcus raffinosus]MDT2528431.1 hypothetical protein [Enterococcus raffinosus]MDT2533102.1 hypothetical protein [Enterococcus raffinosus]MDT2543542.1 hypothetical protein [Enterococcus raffinosus]MDT2553656.1 hypothetical protein [Enterococcus raffinosus]
MNKWRSVYSELQEKQKKKLWIWLSVIFIFFSLYVGATSWFLYHDAQMEDVYWTHYLNENPKLTKDEQLLAKDALKVKTGTYVENINQIDMRSSNYTITFQVWFRWKGNPKLDMLDNYEIYNGQITSQETLKDVEKGDTSYQLARVRATVAKNYWTTRFPMGSHQLRFYIEPKDDIRNIVLEADNENSSINENINISGFDLKRFDTNIFVKEYKNDKSNPETEGRGAYTVTEFVTAMDLNRENIGLYVKCFIALVGTLSWVLIVLFICTYHNVDPLSMIPGALFGTVSNIIVGANLIPDALHIGLLEFVNIFGILIILFASFAIITINRQRSYYKDEAFASFFGKHIFWILTFFTILGNILLPLCAYRF